MNSLYYALGVVIFFGAILVSIGLHELGHMIPAKAFGGKVTQYFIGFGPTVWSRRRGETEYGVKAIPLGGYVKIVGMLPPGAEQLGKVTYDDQGNQVTKIRKSNTGMFTQLISDARAAEWELIGPEDEPRLFYKMPWWKKVIVMAGGPSVNIAIAFFLFWGVFAFYGNPQDRVIEAGAPTISEVSDCVIPYAEQRTTCEPGDPPSPAALAGLEPGDSVTSFNGVAITVLRPALRPDPRQRRRRGRDRLLARRQGARDHGPHAHPVAPRLRTTRRRWSTSASSASSRRPTW